MIHILDNNYKLKAILSKVITSSRREEINAENSLYFNANINEKISLYLTENCIIELDGDYFDVAKITKTQNEDGSCTVAADVEHVSYQLNNEEYNLDTFASTGTPIHVLTEILADTPFSVGTVEPTEAVTYSASESKSRRALLMEFAEYIGAELDFDKFVISLVTHRGNTKPVILSPNKNIKVVSQIYDKTNTDDDGNPLISYTCTPVNTDLSLGDEVLLIQKELGIQQQLRIVSITTNPYDKFDVSVEISNQVGTLEDDIYKIQTSTVIKGKAYNSCSISAENGFVALRGDELAKSVVNATDGFSLYSGTVAGSLEKNFYVDTSGKIVAKEIEIDGSGTFAGTLQAAKGSFTGSIVIGTDDDVFKANGAQGIWLGNDDFVDAPFSVDLEGNLIAHNGKFVDGAVYGSRFYGPDEESAYIKIGMAEGESNLADFQLLRGGGTNPIFSIYDDISVVELKGGPGGTTAPSTFLKTNGTTTYANGTWIFNITNEQTASKLLPASSATVYDCAIKINGILDKLENLGLFIIT